MKKSNQRDMFIKKMAEKRDNEELEINLLLVSKKARPATILMLSDSQIKK